MLAALAGACGDGQVRFGPKRDAGRPTQGAGPGARDYEVDLALLGGRRHRVVAVTRGQDVRSRLPRVPADFRPGQAVMALIPVARRWTHVAWRAARVTGGGAATGFGVVTEEGRRFSGVPGAFLVAPGDTRLRPGQVVRAHAGRSLPFGRVVRVRGEQIRVEIPWLGERREVVVSRSEVLPVDSGLQVAGPVVYRKSGVERLGSLVRAERKYRWVLGADSVVLRLGWTRVTPVTVHPRVPVGARVRVGWPVVLQTARVEQVLFQGLVYEVRAEAGGRGRRRVGFADLVYEPKGR